MPLHFDTAQASLHLARNQVLARGFATSVHQFSAKWGHSASLVDQLTPNAVNLDVGASDALH